MTLLTLHDVSFTYGGRSLFENVTLSLAPGDRLALAGRNGAGKSTLLKLVLGTLEPSSGRVTRAANVRVAALEQRPPGAIAGPARDVVAGGLPELGQRLAEYHERSRALGEAPTPAQLAALDRLHHEIEREGGFAHQAEIERALELVGVAPDAECATLSLGRKRRVMLAKALVSTPDVLVLDEPTNHLDVDAILWLEDFLLRHFQGPRALLFVTHDRAFLRKLANGVAVLERGRAKRYACGYDEFLVRREADLDAEALLEQRMDRRLEREEAWMKQGVKARRTRAEGRVREVLRLREEKRARRERTGKASVDVAQAERSGELVVELKDVTFAHPGAPSPVLAHVSTTVMRGDKIGVVGPNGSGKTTLLRVLLGELAPSAGSVRHGTRLEIAYFDQAHQGLDPRKNVAQNLTDGDYVQVGAAGEGGRRHVVSFLGDFLFRPEQVRGSIEDLSGGERNRLLLARAFTRPSNVLVLDEPTNDLDVETVEVLEELLLAYPGTLLVVSHDREFLNRVVTSTMSIQEDGSLLELVGGYDEWARVRAAAAERDPPAKKPAAKADAAAATGPRKRTYKEQLELDRLPERIEKLEQDRTAIHDAMSTPEFFGDAAKVARETARLEALERDLAQAYARWEELEALRG